MRNCRHIILNKQQVTIQTQNTGNTYHCIMIYEVLYIYPKFIPSILVPKYSDFAEILGKYVALNFSTS